MADTLEGSMTDLALCVEQQCGPGPLELVQGKEEVVLLHTRELINTGVDQETLKHLQT